jgi:surfeit locus 1 family protein
MWRVARRPRWILALLLTLGVAAIFVALSQWQISRSIEQAVVIERNTETVLPLDEIATPQSGVTTEASGQLVTLRASYSAGDFTVLSGRVNRGTEGYWLVGHAIEATSGASIAVGLGWAPTAEEARAAAAGVPVGTELQLSGRYLVSEPSGDDDYQSGERSAMAVATLINEWTDTATPVFGGYLVAETAPEQLTTIDSPRPEQSVELNWLNIFYAVEWVVFAGFAVFLWWRFVRDAWEREELEREELEQAELN